MTTSTTRNEISDALLRAGIYQCLAGVFAYPDPALIESLTARWLTLSKWHNFWSTEMRETISEMHTALQKADVSALAEEYIRLFGPAAYCPLTETSWGDSARLLGKPAQMADISGFYRAFNIHPCEGTETVPEDHLAMELEFMSVLCLKEAYALNAGLDDELDITLDAQKKFLGEHLATWIDYWAESLIANNPVPFYCSLAKTLQHMIHLETGRLGIVPVPIRARISDTEVGEDTFSCQLSSAP